MIRQNLTAPLGTNPVFTFSPASSVDIAGWTIVFYVRDYLGAVVLLTQAASITNSTVGDFSVTLTRDQLLALGAGTFWFSVERTDAGSEDDLAGGWLTIGITARDGMG